MVIVWKKTNKIKLRSKRHKNILTPSNEGLQKFAWKFATMKLGTFER